MVLHLQFIPKPLFIETLFKSIQKLTILLINKQKYNAFYLSNMENLNFDPFNTNNAEVTVEQRFQLFLLAKQGNVHATDILLKSYSLYVEAIILQHQDKNIPEKHTFTNLYDFCIQALEKSLRFYKHFKDFDQKSLWIIRQTVLEQLL